MASQAPFGSSSSSTPKKNRSFLSNASTTPAGPPPTSLFETSQSKPESSADSSKEIFTRSGNLNLSDSLFKSSSGSNDLPLPRENKEAGADSFSPSQFPFGASKGSRPGKSAKFSLENAFNFSQGSEDAWEDEASGSQEELEDEVDDNMDSEETRQESMDFTNFMNSQLSNSFVPKTTPKPALFSPRKSTSSTLGKSKRSKLGEGREGQPPVSKLQALPEEASPIPSILQDIASRSRIAAVEEPGDVIIKTEDEISRIYDGAKTTELQNADTKSVLSEVSSNLTSIWNPAAQQYKTSQPFGAGSVVGPGENAPATTKAGFLASLLLQLHHPPVSRPKPDPFSSRGLLWGPRSITTRAEPTFTTLPRFLLDWLNTNHVPQPGDFQRLTEVEPNPTASSNFWDIIISAVLRGQISEVAEVLHSANFNYARSSLQEGLPQEGYRGAQLQNVQRCINKALQMLESCPGSQHNDWDVKDDEWDLYRKRLLGAVADLEEFAEGGDKRAPEPLTGTAPFQAANFGLTSQAPQSNFSFTQSSRMAESRVPWTIYQNLRSLYRILLGDADAITSHAQDWVEAAVGLTVWWDGNDDGDDRGQADAPGIFQPFSKPVHSRAVDDDPSRAYLERLNLAFRNVTGNSSLQTTFRVNTLSSLEIGLASVFEGNVEGVVKLLQTWSLCVASAVTEVASVGGWLETDAGGKTAFNLSEDDLMVLSYNQNDDARTSHVRKDDVLSTYASGLFECSSVQFGTLARDGWEVALEVLSRLDDSEKMQKSVAEMVDKLPLDTSDQMDKVVLLCSDLGLDKEGRRVSERYGDLTVSKTENYGLALVCYARAHSGRKVKSVVDLLISYSLVQSRAYPAPAELDEQLRSLIREPKACLSAIAEADDEAARILQFNLSGYATLRRFYEIRDEAVMLKEGQKPRLKPLARRRAAAQALVAVISSAADGIYGGLYDPQRDPAVQVDGLLTLLGEALVFIEQPTDILSVSQLFTILSAIEDLETVTPRVYAQCEECFRSTLIEYHQPRRNAGTDTSTSGSMVLAPSPRALLKKSVSSAAPPSSFSLIGNDMVESARDRSNSGAGSAGGSGVLVSRPGDSDEKGESERGWDWRAGLPEDAKGEDVLRILRVGLARKLSQRALGSV